MTADRRAEWPEFVIVRGDGRYYQEFRAVGFLWEVNGRWLRDPKRATKFPSARIATLVAGQLVEPWQSNFTVRRIR